MFYLFWEVITKKYFHLKGRANRKEYISFVVFASLFSFLLELMQYIESDLFRLIFSKLELIAFFYLTIPNITIVVRRFHDLSLSGYSALMILLISACLFFYKTIYSFYGGLVILIIFEIILLIKKGTSGTNKYGEEPIN